MAEATTPFIIGWEEWVALPELGLPAIKAKVDTGAKTSALHAFLIEPFGTPEQPMVRFGIHPIPGRNDIEIYCSAPVVDRREVTSSNGEKEKRLVIRTPIAMGGREWKIEVTLTNRESMTYRMLIGRQAIRADMYVDPAASFRQPKLSYRLYRHLPRHDPVRRPLRIAVLTREGDRPSNRMIVLAAKARGHVPELLDASELSLVFDRPTPGLAAGGIELAHYDAVIPRLGSEDGRFGAAIVRQFEMMGSYAVNSGDALDRLANPLAVAQALAHHGIALDVRALTAKDVEVGNLARRKRAVHRRFLVVGGRTVAKLERRQGRDVALAERAALAEQAIAERAAAALELGLASIHVGEQAGAHCVLKVSAAPALAQFERVTGAPAAEAVIAAIEGNVRSFVRHVELLPAGPAPTAGSQAEDQG
ncbi:MAG TPA: RimK/LysX family protein [Hyphomicrobiaceae bacterium]|nr:RimK/LysX family protein [Hyphomicrobiaceae bacterium]